MQERLRRSGVRSIDAVVDVTNYVLLELGQPLHAFDRNTLAGHVSVRLAQPGERLVLLDGSERELRADMLVIADEQGAIALAGLAIAITLYPASNDGKTVRVAIEWLPTLGLDFTLRMDAREAGVYNSYITAEYQYSQIDDFASADSFRLGDETVIIGLALDL